MKNKFAPFLILPALLMLGACSTVGDWFTSKDDLPPLKGQRISVLQLQTQLVPTTDLQQTPVVLPAAWINAFWPQAGGYPNHVMGQLALGNNLKKAWSSSIGSGGDRRDPLISGPIVADGLVFTLDTDGEVSAFKVSNGDKKWHKSSIAKGGQTSGGIGGGLAYAGGKLYVTNGYKTLVCLDAATGNMVWRVALPTPSQSAPTVMSDKVFVITLDNRLVVYSAADGTMQWNYAGVTETTGLLGSVSPAADTSEVVLPQSSGEILGLHIENGQVIWEDNLSSISHTGTLSSISDIRGQPVIDQGEVYAASYSGKMVALNETTGQRIWQKDIGTAEMPWSAGANVYVISTDQQLVSLTRDKGDIRWVTQLPRHKGSDKDKSIVWTGPLLAGGRLLAASNGSQLIEVSPQDGKILRTIELKGPVFIPPIIASNTLFIVTVKGDLVAYR